MILCPSLCKHHTNGGTYVRRCRLSCGWPAALWAAFEAGDKQILIWIICSFILWVYCLPISACLKSVHLTVSSITRLSVITGNESEQSNCLCSLSLSLSPQTLYLALGSSVYAFTEIAGGIVREKWGFIFLFFSFAISCLQKPLMPIQHQHQGTALMSILATDFFLSPLPAARSVSPTFFLSLFIPSSSLRSLFTVTVQSNH